MIATLHRAWQIFISLVACLCRLLGCRGSLCARNSRFRHLAAAALPLLSSLPGAPVNVYLDFDGHRQPSWGVYSNIVSPPYDRDDKLAELSDEEATDVREVWARVAEDFAPFHVNVTTVDPRDYSNGRGVHVVIGGHYNDWYRTRVGGVSFAGSFTNSMPNVVYVFAKALGNGAPRYVADLVSHEVGHTFGLEEQSVYGERGRRVRDYNSGDSKLWGPLMGNSLSAARSIWFCGASTSPSQIQDDVAIIARDENGFGLRPDDHSDHKAGALRVSERFATPGVISTLRDIDCVRFHTDGGKVELHVDVAETGPNLDARLELTTAAGRLVAYDDPADKLGASLTVELAAGEYCVLVRSHGSYGDLGQYTLSGAIEERGTVLARASLKRNTPSARRDAEAGSPSDEPLANAHPTGADRESGAAPLPAAGPVGR